MTPVTPNCVVPLLSTLKWGSDESKFRSLKLNLKTVPDDVNSASFTQHFYIFGSGTAEEWLHWEKDFEELVKNLKLTTGAAKIGMVKKLLEGSAKKHFENFLVGKTETVANCDAALKKVKEPIFGEQAAELQKRYLRYGCKKPKGLCVRETAHAYVELNEDLPRYPNFNNEILTSKLTPDEVKSGFFRLLPNHWIRKIEETPNFNENSASFADIVDFAERLELSEKSHENKQKNQTGRDANSGKSKKRSTPELGGDDSGGNHSKKKKHTPMCRLHGEGHDSHECKVWINHAEKMTAQWKAQHPAVKGKSKFIKAKKPFNGNKKYSVEEVNLLLQKFKDKQTCEEINTLEVDAPIVETNQDEEMFNADAELEKILNS